MGRTDNQVHITVKINFTGSPPNKNAVVTRWLNAIKVTWNQFKAVKKGGAMSRDIVFDPQNTGGSAHHTVAVMPGTGRSNAAQWFVTAQDQVAGHEFGHLIGLPDEYQLSHGDYVSTIGEAPDKGKKTGDAPSATIAQKLRTALLTKAAEQSAAEAEYTAAADDAGRNVTEAKFNTARSDRAAAVRAVVAGHTLKQGNFARRIGTAYKKAFGTDLVSDLADNIPSADQWSITNPFTYSAGGTMGDFFSKDENNAPGSTDTAGHTHSVAPRHMRMFVSYAQHAKGGVWEAERK